MKQIEVRIMGQNYLLGCADGAEQELLDAVRLVDKEMCDIRDAGKLRARERIAVLAALNVALLAGKRKPLQTPLKQEITPGQIDADCKNLIYKIDEILAKDGQLL